MAHFPESFIAEVQSRTDIVDVIGRHVELKKSGSNLVGLCPFHHEKTPSFSVSPDKQLFYCFGCGKGGGVFQFLMEHDGFSFPEAVEYLARKAGLDVPRQQKTDHRQTARMQAGYQLLAKAAELYARTLHSEQGKKAMAYLAERGLPREIIRGYGLGYAPGIHGFLARKLAADPEERSLLEQVGLVASGRHGRTDRFRERLMFPIRDRRGNIVGFGGRLLGKGEPKYLNSSESPWFHKSRLLYGFSEHRHEIRRRKMLVVVEGYMDVLALAAHGLPVALAPLGTAIGEHQLSMIFRLHDEPVFCFDGDKAGRQAAWRALERMLPLLNAELAPRFLYLPEGDDPDSLVRREGARGFEERLQGAQTALQFWLKGLHLLAGTGPEGRARMARKADVMLAALTDDYLRQVWRQEAEKVTGVKLARTRGAQVGRPSSGVASVALSELQERFLAALMQKPQRFRQLPEVARHFFVDYNGVTKVYMRAFSIVEAAEDRNVDVAGQLLHEFPQQTEIARWVNQAPVPEMEFDYLCLAMEANYIRKKQRSMRGRLSLKESQSLQMRLQHIERELRRLGEKIQETGVREL
ncbi:MAG: DNA primase [Zetaproteobacteria bacterium]|nr:MAG: DNA primase [Zetaproteobacteria bacterium]